MRHLVTSTWYWRNLFRLWVNLTTLRDSLFCIVVSMFSSNILVKWIEKRMAYMPTNMRKRNSSLVPFVSFSVFYYFFFQAYRLEPLLSEDYVAIPPAQLPRYDSKQGTDGRPSKTRASGKWGGLFTSYRMGFHRHKPEAEEAGSNSEENEYEDEVVIVHNATAEDKTVGTKSNSLL